MVLKLKTAIIMSGLVLMASPLLADSLVMFRNGKAMRVKSVIKDGDWLKCEFEDKNFISVPAAGVLKIEEAALGSTAGELRANQVAAGTGGGYVPPPRDAGVPNEPAEEESAPPPPDEDFLRQQQLQQQQQLGVVGGRGSLANRNGRAGVPIPPGTNPGVQQGVPQGIQGLQPLNQANSPFHNRRLSEQRGINRNRTAQPQNQSAQDE